MLKKSSLTLLVIRTRQKFNFMIRIYCIVKFCASWYVTLPQPSLFPIQIKAKGEASALFAQTTCDHNFFS